MIDNYSVGSWRVLKKNAHKEKRKLRLFSSYKLRASMNSRVFATSRVYFKKIRRCPSMVSCPWRFLLCFYNHFWPNLRPIPVMGPVVWSRCVFPCWQGVNWVWGLGTPNSPFVRSDNAFSDSSPKITQKCLKLPEIV